ncbi:MAG: rhomboid family intramembrane serine protease [Anaerolineae bacterium]|nr:rhomboid family intramembrane serine protease [Anaerolineae bacterium]MDW8068999.1 rhomboid family intramembrane serine protease [Anaerolineae bacterium]
MIPVSDELPYRRVPLVTWGLIAANVLAFLWELMLGPDLERFLMTWGAVPAFITNPTHYPWAPLTLLTSMFLHGGWMHLIGNMLYLWIFGDNVEDALGHLGYLLFYLVAGVGAGLAQVMVAPSSRIPGVGASGAIAGVLAVYLVLYPAAPVRVLVPGFYMMRIARVPALIVLGFWFVIQLFNGVLSLGTATMATGGIAWFAHIGGFLVGLLVGLGARAFGVRRYYG